MAFFQNIRNKAGEYFLLKQHAQHSRARTIMNMDSAISIGIVYCGDNPEDVEMIKKLCAHPARYG